MKWFGNPWPSEDLRAAVCEDDKDRVPPPPPGEICMLCREQFKPGDQGVVIPHMASDGWVEMHYHHLDCLIRSVGAA